MKTKAVRDENSNKQLKIDNTTLCDVTAYLLKKEMEQSLEEEDLDETNVLEFMKKIGTDSKGAFEKHREDMVKVRTAPACSSAVFAHVHNTFPFAVRQRFAPQAVQP